MHTRTTNNSVFIAAYGESSLSYNRQTVYDDRGDNSTTFMFDVHTGMSEASGLKG